MSRKSKHSYLPALQYTLDSTIIQQRPVDGYVDATNICKSTGKRIGHYLQNKETKEFIEEVVLDTGIPTSKLIQIIRGRNLIQGTWVHPDIAIHLAQWASPKFGLFVSRLVRDWASGKQKRNYELPYHVRRYLLNLTKIPVTHFSMLNEVTMHLFRYFEQAGYHLPNKLMPDISLGKIFSNQLKALGYDPESFPTYLHEFDDGKRPIIKARLYPNQLRGDFIKILHEWITGGAMLKYFKERDPEAMPLIEKSTKMYLKCNKQFLDNPLNLCSNL